MNGSNDTIVTRFAATVAARPDAVAIEDNLPVRYAELAQRAKAVAVRLPSVGSAPGRVAILADDRTTAIASMFGTAMSGHAYVPLDAGDPDARLRLIMEDAAPFTIVADPSQADRASALCNGLCSVLVVDSDSVEAIDDSRLLPVTPESLLFVQYTSGSSGRPKGVRQTHRNLLFYSNAYARTLGMRPDDRLSLLYTLSFSASNMDIYGGLLRGATLCPRDLRREGVHDLAKWLLDRRITILHTVPTVFRELTRSLEAKDSFTDLRAIDLGGEALFAEDIRRFIPHVGRDCLFVNHLAATEISVISQFAIRADTSLPQGLLPAGRSPDGVQVTILTDKGEPASPGDSGRIAIDSDHLSPGYWQRPELNLAFTNLPDKPGWRRYLTEDCGRIDAEGILYFTGRSGARVKIRGHSVDLHEIEAALLACANVSEAAVTSQDSVGLQAERLVAFVVLAPSAEMTVTDLHRQLTLRLPAYMLPSAYAFRDALPRTDTGKIDRRGLAAIAPEVVQPRPDFLPPKDEYERQVAEIFSRLLECESVGRADDFFLLGGDSLRAVELQLALRAAFGRDVPDLVEHSTVARCAARVREGVASGLTTSMPLLVPLRPTGSRPPLYLIHGRLGQAFISPAFAALFDEDQPLFAIQAKGLDGITPPAATIEEMVADYVAAIQRHQPKGPYFLGALCAGSYVAMAMAETLADAGHPLLPMLLFDPPEPWSSAPVGRNQVERQIRVRHAENKIDAPVGDARLLKAAVDVAQAFERAIRRYSPKKFKQRAFVLMSRNRLCEQWTARLLSSFLGDSIEYMIVGEKHQDVLDPRNAEFKVAVRKCLSSIGDNGSPDNNLNTIGAPHESILLRCRSRWRRLQRSFGF